MSGLRLLAGSFTKKVMMPCLSIYLPTYNRAPFLEITLAALAPQIAQVAPGAVEVLIVDNVSTDSTPEVCARYPQFQYIRNPQMVMGHAHIRKLSGTYAWVVCDDDFIHEGTVPRLVEMIQAAGTARPVFLLNYAQVDQPGTTLLSSGVCDFSLPSVFPTLADFLPVEGSFDIIGFLPARIFPLAPFLETHYELFDKMRSCYDFVGPFLEAYLHTPVIYVATPMLTQRQNNQRFDGEYHEVTISKTVSSFLAFLKMLGTLEDLCGVPMTQTLKMRQRIHLQTNSPCVGFFHFFVDTFLKPNLMRQPDNLNDGDLAEILAFADRLPDRGAAMRLHTLIRLARSVAEIRRVMFNS